MAGCGGKKRTESKVRQIVCGLMIFAGVLHFIYLIVAMAGTWDARFQPVPVNVSLNASSAYKPNPAALFTGLLLGVTGFVLCLFGVFMMFEICGLVFPGITCALNLLALMLMIRNISSGLQTPIGVGVGWLIVDFVLFVSAGYVCWLERKTCPCLKDGDVKGGNTFRLHNAGSTAAAGRGSSRHVPSEVAGGVLMASSDMVASDMKNISEIM